MYFVMEVGGLRCVRKVGGLKVLYVRAMGGFKVVCVREDGI